MSSWPRGPKLYQRGLLVAHRTTAIDDEPAERWELVAPLDQDEQMRRMFVAGAYLARDRPTDCMPRFVALDDGVWVVTAPPWIALDALPKPLPVGIVVTLIRELARQLTGDKHLVLRTLAPATLAIAITGRARLLDLTLAKHIAIAKYRGGGRAGETQPGVLKGEIAYLSPEGARGTGLDSRADVFSLGSVAFELLTGERAFIGGGAMEVLMKVRNGIIDRLDRVGALHGAEIQALIERMTIRTRKDRTDWAALVTEIETGYAHALWSPERVADELRRLAPKPVADAVLYAY